MSQECLQDTHSIARTKATPKQTVLVEPLKPLCIGYIRFASWHILHKSCVHQKHLKATRLENLVYWDPIGAR